MKLLTKDLSPIVKILMSVAILMTSISLTSLLMSFVQYINPTFSKSNEGSLIIQAIGSISMFGLSAWVCSSLFIRNFKTNFTNTFSKRWIIWAVIIPIASIPLNDLLQVWNDSLHFQGEEIFRKIQQLSEAETKKLLTSNTLTGLLGVSFVLAVIPAIVEELFFRGVVQTFFKDLFKNIHIAIIVTSVFFSLMHFELFSFLPRFLLSCFLGYLFVYSGNLIISIIAHFINNFIVCLLYYFYATGVIQIQDSVEFSQHPILIALSVTIILLIIIFEFFFVFLRNKAN